MELKSIRKIATLVFIHLALYNCSEGVNTNLEETGTTSKQESKFSDINQRSKRDFWLDSTEYTSLIHLDSIYTKVPFFTKLDNHLLFYVCNGKWQKRTYENNKSYPSEVNLKFGLVNSNMELLLPVEYDKIYNPDLTVKGYIEIEKNGLLGLYNYNNNKVINCEFDVIFPSNNSALAVGEKDGKFYEIFENEILLKYDSLNVPRYTEFLPELTFNALDDNVTYIMDSYYSYYEGDPIEGNGVVVTPSYLDKLNILPEIQPNILIKGDGDFGIIKSENKIVESRNIGKEITALISAFYEEGIDGRGHQLNQQRVLIIDKNNEVLSNKMLSEYYSYNEFYFCERGNPSLRFINDSLIEFKEMVSNPSDYKKYRTMPSYKYYTIDNSGGLTELSTNRIFEFTKYIWLTPDYFSGCFTKYTEENKDYYFGEVYLLEHLSLNDLNVMRNEIYAEYGYVFKSKKWNEYFKSKNWYEPKFENVDSLLTEIDKHNIKLILNISELLKTEEEKLVNKTKIEFGLAG